MYICNVKLKNMRKRFYKLIVTSFLAFGSFSAGASVVYVRAAGESGDGKSWETAFTDLHQALDASVAGDEIWIAEGLYKPVRIVDSRVANSRGFTIKDGVSIYGGFAGTETDRTQRELVAGGKPWEFVHETILDGNDDVPDVWEREITPGTTYRHTWKKDDTNQIPGTDKNATHLLYQSARIVNHTVIDGLTVRGGNANAHRVKTCGGAIYAIGNVSINACRFYENSCWLRNEVLDVINALGGAVYLNGTDDASVVNCHFARNYSNSSYSQGLGGGLFAQNAKVEGCLFEDCVGEDGGGAAYIIGGQTTGCEAYHSYASAGGGFYVVGVLNSAEQVLAQAQMSDITVADCQGLNGGGIYVDLGATLTHAKVYSCKADATEFGDQLGGHGGGIFVQGGSVFGCVAYNNMAYLGAGLCIRAGKVANCTLQHNADRNADPAVSNLAEWPDTGMLKNVVNTIGNPDAEMSNFLAPSAFTGLAQDSGQLAQLAQASWELAPGSSFIDAGVSTEGQESTDMAGNPRVAGSSIDVGAYEFRDERELANAVLTFDGQKESIILRLMTIDGNLRFRVGSAIYTVSNAQPNVNKAVEVPLEGSNCIEILAPGLSRLNVSEQGLTKIDVTAAPQLTILQVGTNALTALDVSKNTMLTGIYAENNNIASLDLTNNKALRVLQIFSNKLSGTLDLSAMDDLSSVDIDNNSVTALILPRHSKLVEVNCEGNKLTSLDIAGRTGLRDVNLYDNKVTALDLTGLVALEALYAGNNAIAEVKGLDGCKVLETLNISGNRLTEIDLSGVTALTGLYLYDNELTSLDISANNEIAWMNVNNNHIAALDISHLSNLRLLHACGNEISELDLSNSPYCQQLTVADNRLATLDVSKQTALYWLKADGNELSDIDLSANTYLSLLEIGRNKLTTLDVSKNTMLRRIAAEENSLSALDIAGLAQLCGLEIQGNNMETDAIDAVIAALPDVTGQEPLAGSEWISILNISDMPGTSAADVAAAQQKGWRVTATSGIDSPEAEINAEVVAVSYWSLTGQRLERPAGICIARFTLADGSTVARKIRVK